ncbi:MAG TPA: ATP-binding protein [Thermoanaerobaculia bacterium]|nr:ATP-binding protein [Thermoanaerobaculia bacterium]
MPAPGDASAACGECGGTGWVPSAEDHARVARCSCRRRRDAERLVGDAGIPPRYRFCSLGVHGVALKEDEETRRRWGFQVSSHPQLLAAAVACKHYVESFLAPENGSGRHFRDTGLLFTGPPGAGKTHLAAATLRELIASYRVRGRFVDFTSLTQDLQTAIDPDAPRSRLELLDPVENAEVLVVDELGAQTLRPWAADVLYDLINRRYARRLPTLFTTNYQLDDAAGRQETLDRGADVAGHGLLSRRIPGMLVSRLWEMTQVVSLDAVRDYRMEVRAHQHRA